jgi:hypothetical protein
MYNCTDAVRDALKHPPILPHVRSVESQLTLERKDEFHDEGDNIPDNRKG